ncbi:lytic polysaccharide monooxygenase auxiliary activity family 9 protein [Micromonospora yangpuensis]|uniref:Chitin-binding protein n=1 Tax=Micromonospora yangpuensis TaxID=683228 RepID=A0A1C6U851_9ACTN|nr:lytic polysaccharide monooxygenase [Micromonospora yangpuensis]GGL89795.1 hypothetical protein GCM10012279_04310 [Micromonospora yangpuensis]SCL50113.1 chitin-binding protein [Micromonospora yangpuensis]
MTVRRTLAAVGVAAAAVLFTGAAVVLPPTGPASAHGAPVDPVSRSAGCAPGSPAADTPACRAAVAAGAALREWDNIRVYGVAGRDREVIPDGELCSGGLSAYRGLDLPRVDWPTTELTGGSAFTFRYRNTVEQRGTFRLYLTVDGYDPNAPLTWADLDRLPFLRVTDPPVRGGEYRVSGILPAGRTGRHLIYTVWQNSDTPDTYYSCSDVLLRSAGDDRAAPSSGDDRAAPSSVSAVDAAVETPSGTASAAQTDPGVPVASVTATAQLPGGRPLLVGAAVVVVPLLVGMAAVRLRRPRPVAPGRPCQVRNHRVGKRRIW